MPWVPRYWVVIIFARPLMAIFALLVLSKMVAGDSELSGLVFRYSFWQAAVMRTTAKKDRAFRILFFFIFISV